MAAFDFFNLFYPKDKNCNQVAGGACNISSRGNKLAIQAVFTENRIRLINIL